MADFAGSWMCVEQNGMEKFVDELSKQKWNAVSIYRHVYSSIQTYLTQQCSPPPYYDRLVVFSNVMHFMHKIMVQGKRQWTSHKMETNIL